MTRAASLTAKQARFAAEYVKDLNGSAAAARAGYSQASARRIASQLLDLPHVRAEVQRLEAVQLEKVGVTAEGVIEQLRRVAFFDVATIYETKDVPYLIETAEKYAKIVGEQYKCGCTILVRSEESLAKGCGIHGPETAIQLPLTAVVRERRLKHPADWPAPARHALAGFDTVVRNLTAGDGLVDTVLKVKLNDRLRALEMLAQHLGLLKEQVDVQQTITMQWLPPEPPPSIETETVDALAPSNRDTLALDGAPSRPDRFEPPVLDPSEPMGFPPAPPAPHHRTLPRILGESGGSGNDELDEAAVSSGISKRQQERMFPELRKSKGV